MNPHNFSAKRNNYLKKFGEDKWQLEWKQSNDINVAIIIPAINEYHNIDKIYTSLKNSDPKFHKNTLVVFVINNTISTADEIKKDNQKTLQYLKSKFIESDTQLNFGLVDAASPGLELPQKDGGVGYARKIGMDLALKSFTEINAEKNLIVCLDADCTVDSSYITKIYNAYKEKVSAGYVDFRHPILGNEDEQKAIICYEIFLRYYVLGLQYSNSPFAFHTIGSTMCCSAGSYVQVQGMNKRKAAEDFYFMEKLAKVTGIKKIVGTAIHPSGRPSMRVPFGTGQRVNRFLKKVQNEYLLYAPQSFEILKNWHKIFYDPDALNAAEILHKAENIDKQLKNFLTENDFENQWQNILDHTNSEAQLSKQKKFWFDGFKTLKLIHYLRDNSLPMANMFRALDELLQKNEIEFHPKSNQGKIPSIDIQKEYLNILREIA